MKKINILFILAFLNPVILIFGQDQKGLEEFMNHWLNLKKLKNQVTYPDTVINRNLEINVYMCGVEATLEQDVIDVVEEMNTQFAPIKLAFTVCRFFYVENYNYFNADDENDKEIIVKYSTPNSINLYLVSGQVSVKGMNVCGYAYYPFPLYWDYIFIDDYCLNVKTFTHEMGHFFGLMHTHETHEGDKVEYADGSNSSSAGDYISDTPADPDLSIVYNLPLLDDFCNYVGYRKDPKGDYYAPLVSNHMSYAPQSCRCSFTKEQYKRMVENYFQYKTHLRGTSY